MMESPQPVAATVAGNDIADVVVNAGRTCVRRNTGLIACWGDNESGQFGDGTRTSSLTPVSPLGLSDVRQLAIDDTSTSCVLLGDGSVACWGGSPQGASPPQGSLVPVAIENLTGAIELQGGVLGRYCARGSEGWTRCFRLVLGTWTAAVDVPAMAGARGLAIPAQDEVCGLFDTVGVRCQDLASGAVAELPGSGGSVEMKATGLYGCARNAQDSWRCWNLLPPMLHSVGSPAIEIPSDVPMREVAIGGLRLCGVRTDDSVVCGNASTGSAALTPVGSLPP
jgi:hypothetical protein